MSLFKAKEKGGEPLTVFGKAKPELKKIMEQKETADERAQELMKKLSEEKSGVKVKLDELEGRIKKLTSEYVEALDGFKAEKAKQIEEASVTEEDLKKGLVSVGEFFAVGKRKADIEKESRLAAEAEMDKVRDVIRELQKERLDYVRKLREIEERIARTRSELATHFYFSLKSMLEKLQEAGIGNTGVTTAHVRKQEADNDFFMATKGGGVTNPVKQFSVRSVEEAELLVLNPIIKVEHFPEFRAFLESIRNLDFAELTVNYSPASSPGRNAGDFSCFHRPKVLER